MRRYVLLILLVLVLLTPFVMRLFLGAKTSAAPAAGGKVDTIIIITSHVEGIRREFADAFRPYYKAKTGRDVNLDYISLGTEDGRRLIEDRETLYKNPRIGTYQLDLVWGGGDYYFDRQINKHLQGVEIDPAIMHEVFPQPDLHGLALYDTKNNPPHWYGAALSSFGFTYNRDVLKSLGFKPGEEPKTWADLADFRYCDWLIAADPARSVSAKTAFMAIVEREMANSALKHEDEVIGWQRGMGMVRLICSNARNFIDGSNLVPGIIASGDAAAGMTIDFYGRSEAEAVNLTVKDRLNYVQPVGATIINPDPIAMLLGAEHREAAKMFMEFVLSRQGQLLWDTKAGAPGGPKQTSLRRLPIMPGVYSDMTNFSDPDNPFSASNTFNKDPKREDPTFGILGEMIQVSCMNCLEDLRRTRIEIEGSKKANELRARLANFPFDMNEAVRRKVEYNSADPVTKLALLRAWTDEFKAEYSTLRTEAAVK